MKKSCCSYFHAVFFICSNTKILVVFLRARLCSQQNSAMLHITLSFDYNWKERKTSIYTASEIQMQFNNSHWCNCTLRLTAALQDIRELCWQVCNKMIIALKNIQPVLLERKKSSSVKKTCRACLSFIRYSMYLSLSACFVLKLPISNQASVQCFFRHLVPFVSSAVFVIAHDRSSSQTAKQCRRLIWSSIALLR